MELLFDETFHALVGLAYGSFDIEYDLTYAAKRLN